MSQALAEAGAESIALLETKQEIGDRSTAELHRTTGMPVQFLQSGRARCQSNIGGSRQGQSRSGLSGHCDQFSRSCRERWFSTIRMEDISGSFELTAQTSKPKTMTTQFSAISSTSISLVPSSSHKPVLATWNV